MPCFTQSKVRLQFVAKGRAYQVRIMIMIFNSVSSRVFFLATQQLFRNQLERLTYYADFARLKWSENENNNFTCRLHGLA